MTDDWLIILRNDESFWRLESALRVKTGRFFFWKFRDFEMVELSWVTYPEKFFFRWSYCNGRPTWVKNAKISFKVVKNTEIFQSDLIVMSDLPRWKFFGGGEKCEDFSKIVSLHYTIKQFYRRTNSVGDRNELHWWHEWTPSVKYLPTASPSLPTEHVRWYNSHR
jgi:hypothetical protein